MKHAFALLLAIATAAIADPPPALTPPDTLPEPPSGKKWKLIFNDEFDGDKLDTTKWTMRPDGRRKDGWWDKKTVSLDGKGHLSIALLNEGDKWMAGNVITAGKFEHAFGYWVCRVQFQKQPGHWSAFWLMTSGVGKVGDDGRDGTEIDIFEKPTLDDRIEHNLHWDGYTKEHHKSTGKKLKIPGMMEGWHTCGLWWTEKEYVFYVDGKETWRTSAGGVSQVKQYLMLSTEVGKWAGKVSEAKLPDAFLVDYVRVYDLVDAK